MFDGTPECTPTAFVAIYGTPGLGRQLLSFFTVFQKPYFDPDPLFWVVLGRGLDAGFVAIYGGRGHSGLTLAMLGNRILSLFTVLKHPICHAWEGLEITFCRFLRCPWALVPCLGRLGNYALSFLRFLR